jgi:hypothetical protein
MIARMTKSVSNSPEISASEYETAWVTVSSFTQLTKNRKIIFWGCFDWFEKTKDNFRLDPVFLVDRSINQQGPSAHHGYDVFDPSHLMDLHDKDKYFVVITISNDFDIVIRQLVKYGFIPGIHFCVSPLLNSRKIISDIVSHKQELILSSSNAPEAANMGGGIYTLALPEGTITRKKAGICRGLAFYKSNLFVVDAINNVCILDKTYKQIDRFNLPKQSVPHGIAIDEQQKKIFIVLSQHDKVAVFDLSDFKMVDEISITKKHSPDGKYRHHMNDICIIQDSLFISMFSYSGNIQNGIYDGAIVEYDLKSGAVIGPINSDLWQPHSVTHIDKQLCYLDSMRGNLHLAAHKVAAHFNGFIRGLDFDGKYYFVGQSTHRYFDRMTHTSNNISLDCGVFVFDDSTKASKFYSTKPLTDINTVKVSPHGFN